MRTIINIALSLSLLVTLTANIAAHNLYTSFTRIDWNENDNSLEVVIEMFAHELEAKLSLDTGKQMTFLNEADYNVLASILPEYIQNNFIIISDNSTTNMTYLGFEVQNEVVYIYMESDLAQKPRKLTVMNAMLIDEFPGQINSITAAVGKKTQSEQIKKNGGPITFEF